MHRLFVVHALLFLASCASSVTAPPPTQPTQEPPPTQASPPTPPPPPPQIGCIRNGTHLQLYETDHSEPCAPCTCEPISWYEFECLKMIVDCPEMFGVTLSCADPFVPEGECCQKCPEGEDKDGDGKDRYLVRSKETRLN